MAKTLSELTNDVKFKTDWRTLDRIKKRMQQLDKQGKALHKSLAKPIKMRVDNAGMNKARKQIGELEKSASRLRGTLSKPMRVSVDGGRLASVRSQMAATRTEAGLLSRALAFGGGFVGGAALASVARGFFETNMTMQQLKGALKTTTGSTAAANAEFKKLQAFGATTPFTTEQAIRGFIKLKNLGLDPSTAALRSYGNTASAMGKSLSDMIEAVADASTGEFERLKEFGIKSKSQGDMVEFTFQNVKTKVKKDAKDIEGYIRKIGDTQFAKAMADQMNSLPGMMSNAQDSIETFYDAVGEAGVNQALIPILREFSMMLSGIDAAPIGKNIGAFITMLFNGVKDGIGGIKQLIAELGGIDGIARIAGAALAVMMAPVIGGQIIAAVKGVQALVAAAKGLTLMSAGQGLFALLGGWPLLIGAAVIALGFLAYDIFKFATGGESMIGKLAAKFPLFGQMVKTVGDAFNSVLPILQGWWGQIQQMGAPLMSIFQSLGLLLYSAFQAAAPAVMAIIGMLAEVGSVVLQLIGFAISFSLQFITALLHVAAFIAQWVSIALSLMIAFVGGAIGMVVSLAANFIGTWARMLGAIIGFVASMGLAILAFVTNSISAFIQMFTNSQAAGEQFKAGLQRIISSIGSAFQVMIDSVVGSFMGGFDRIKGIVEGLKGSVGKVLGKINSAGSGVAKTSMALPGGGRGGVFAPNFNNGGNTFNVYDTDPARVGALFDRALSGASSSQLSDFARSVPVMLPGSA